MNQNKDSQVKRNQKKRRRSQTRSTRSNFTTHSILLFVYLFVVSVPYNSNNNNNKKGTRKCIVRILSHSHQAAGKKRTTMCLKTIIKRILWSYFCIYYRSDWFFECIFSIHTVCVHGMICDRFVSLFILKVQSFAYFEGVLMWNIYANMQQSNYSISRQCEIENELRN